MEASATVTVSVLGGDTTVPMVAVIWVAPAASVVATPALLMVATLAVSDFQMAVVVTSLCDPSE